MLYEFHGQATGDQFGHSVAAAGDVNGDGRADVIVGAPRNAANGTNSGAAYVYSGLDGSLLFTLHGHAAEIQFGWSVAGAGDIDNDGHADVIVGANLDDAGADPDDDSGSARVFSGLDGSQLYVFLGTPKDQLGYSVSGAGDVNRDGHPDVIIGTFMSLPFQGSDKGRAEVHSGIACGPCFPVGTSYCFGHGGATSCPCNNNSAPGSGQGCLNSSAIGGVLAASGSASLSSDTLQLASSHELPSALSIVLQGSSVIAPLTFGDGLRCAGGSLKRLYVKHAIIGVISAPQAGDPSISARSATLGDPIPLGATRAYQVYYRDPNLGFCPGAFNVTNAIAIAWGS